MNLDDFKKSLADKTLDLAAVKAHLDELEPATPPATAENPLADLPGELAALKTQLTALKSELEKIGAQPGAAKSTPGVPATDAPLGDTHPSDLEKFNKEMAEMAEQGRTPYRPQG